MHGGSQVGWPLLELELELADEVADALELADEVADALELVPKHSCAQFVWLQVTAALYVAIEFALAFCPQALTQALVTQDAPH
jgi:hypothetical protein